MCGIALISGPGAEQPIFRMMMDQLRHRGEVAETLAREDLLAGTQRLRIVDAERSAQPWTSADGRWLLCYNGEVFNFGDLRERLRRLGHELTSQGDTETVMEAFREWGFGAPRRLRGEFAIAIAEIGAGRVFLARDPVGVKPLYYAMRSGRLHVASEIKALVPVGSPILPVPPGHCGWAEPGAAPVLEPYAGLDRLGTGTPITDPDEAAALIREKFADSVRVRVATDLTVGVVLSGGVDSTLTLRHVRQEHPDCVAITIGSPGSEDLAYASRVAADLGVPHEIVRLAPRDIGWRQVREAIRIGELSEYGDIINAVVSVPLFRRIRELGIKVVLTGDGSDELFGGYPMYQRVGAEDIRNLFYHKIVNLGRTELQRVDRAAMSQGVEARVPFLDLKLVDLALRMPMDLKVRDGVEKWILRRAFADALPDYVLARPKNPMSHSSGLHERARLYKPLFARAHRSFGYDRCEPVRRDFSILLESCGNDLDLASELASARTDYTMREHARDLAGAARRNAGSLLRPRRPIPPGQLSGRLPDRVVS